MILLRGALTLTVVWAIAGGARAQTAQVGGGIDVREGVQVSTLQRTAFANRVEMLAPTTAGMIEATAVIQISSDPGRSFRVRMPHLVSPDGDALLQGVSAHSQNAGDMAASHQGHTDTDGRDVVRVASRLRLPSDFQRQTATAVPLSVDVE